jgi:enhancing lycopene biosynthesis protein 2
MVNAQLTQNTSVYDLAVKATDLVPTDDETAEILMRLGREHMAAEIEHKVSRWFQSI